jgi:transcriptional regulator with XRE-family HTH domain
MGNRYVLNSEQRTILKQASPRRSMAHHGTYGTGMDPGLRLKNIRESLGLRYRDVEHASNVIAKRRKSSDFAVGLSRLADIENRGVIPSVQRLYSLCAIYRIDFEEALEWYGVPLGQIWADATTVHPPNTHPISLHEPAHGAVRLPIQIDPGIDFNKTQFLSRIVQRWGSVPLVMLGAANLDSVRFGMIGWEDTRMFPLLRPGAIVQIDTQRRQIENRSWTSEFERPIYFLELRTGYACCWCSRSGDQLILQPHHGSPDAPEVLKFRQDVDVIGQIVGVAMHLTPESSGSPQSNRRLRAASTPK